MECQRNDFSNITEELLSARYKKIDEEIMSPSAKLSKLLIRTPLFIALYCSLSITLTFYNKWFIKDFHFPLTGNEGVVTTRFQEI